MVETYMESHPVGYMQRIRKQKIPVLNLVLLLVSNPFGTSPNIFEIQFISKANEWNLRSF